MKRVLIVDDSKQVRERLISLLSEYPTIRIVGQAGNGKEALDALDDLIVQARAVFKRPAIFIIAAIGIRG